MPAAAPDRGPRGTAADPDRTDSSPRTRSPVTHVTLAARAVPQLGLHTEARPSGPRTHRRGPAAPRGPGPGNARCHKGGHVGPARPAALSRSGRAASATRRLHPGRPGGLWPWPAEENRRPGVTAALSPLPASPSPGRATGPRPLLRAPLAATQPGLAARA